MLDQSEPPPINSPRLLRYTQRNPDLGRGARFKLCMKFAGIDFTDTIVRCADWDERKSQEFREISLGQLPILKVDDKIFCQSDAIFEWAAKKANLVPEDPDKALAMRMSVGEFCRLLFALVLFIPNNI